MKKLIVVACALFCANIYARSPEEIKTEIKSLRRDQVNAFEDNITTEEWRQIADVEIASGRGFNPSAFWNMIGIERKNCEPLLDEYDVKFAATSHATNWFGGKIGFKRTPKCSQKYAEITIGKNRPGTAEVCKSAKGSFDSTSLLQRIIVFSECYADNKGVLWIDYNYNRLSNWVLDSAPKALKKLIREKGKSFLVGADGRNPLQNAIDSLLEALNRPRLQGLKEWVAEWYPDHVWNEPVWMSKDRLDKLMDDIYFGQIDFDWRNQSVLRANLGLEGYNEFVKKYNN